MRWPLAAALLAAALISCRSEGSASGVLVGVESTGLSDVQAVTLRAEDGAERRFALGPEAARAGHPLSAGHLRQHMTHGDRVTIRYRDTPEGPVALEIADG